MCELSLMCKLSDMPDRLMFDPLMRDVSLMELLVLEVLVVAAPLVLVPLLMAPVLSADGATAPLAVAVSVVFALSLLLHAATATTAAKIAMRFMKSSVKI
jgi:hypothetical protein